VLIQEVRLRNLLRAYVRGTDDSDETDEDSSPSLSNLRNLCDEVKHKWLLDVFDLIEELAEHKGQYEKECPTVLERLLLSISMPTPVSGFVLKGDIMGPQLAKLSAGHNAIADLQMIANLNDNCPCLAQLLQSPLCAGGVFPVRLRPLLRHLSEMTGKYLKGARFLFFFSLTSFVDVKQDEKELPARFKISLEEGIASCYPLIRAHFVSMIDLKRGCYYADQFRWHRHGRCHEHLKQNGDSEDSDCRREPATGKPLSPGLLLVYCPHGICHGFQLLDRPEGDSHVFEWYWERFPCGMSSCMYK
jgi:hypothetical protein